MSAEETMDRLVVEQEELIEEEDMARVQAGQRTQYSKIVRQLVKSDHEYKSGPVSLIGVQAHVETLQYALEDSGFEPFPDFGFGDFWYEYIKASRHGYLARLRAKDESEEKGWEFIVKSKFDMPMIQSAEWREI